MRWARPRRAGALAGALAAVLAAVAPAQTAPAAPAPLLRAVGRDADWMARLAGFCGAAPAAPLGPGAHELLVPADGAARLAPAPPGDGPRLHAALRVRAAALRHPQGTAELLAELPPLLALLPASLRLPPRAEQRLRRELAVLLRSIDELAVQVDDLPAAGRRVAVTLRPHPDTPLAAWCAALQPSEAAPLQLPLPAAALRLQGSVARAGAAAAVAPFAPLLAGLGAGDDAAADAALDELLGLLPRLDGRFAAVATRDRLLLATGLADAAGFAAAMQSETRLRRRRDRAAAHGLRIEHTPGALQHRGVELLATRTHGAAAGSWLADGLGVVTAFAGCAGGLWLQVGGPDGAVLAPQLVDAALDGRLDGAATAGPAPLLSLQLDLARLAGDADAGGLTTATLAARDGALQLVVVLP